MSQPLGIDDFFVLEAGEYLERLALLVTRPAPAPDELVRFTRALRGSALMASQHAIARAAGGLEGVVRGYRDGRREWNAATARVAGDAVAEIRELVVSVRGWTDEHTRRAERLAQTLEGEVGASGSPASRTLAVAGDAGVRAFIAREGAVVASTLDQASRALKSSPQSMDPVQAVLKRMQPLRGLAALSDFPPLPELLDGVDRTAADLARGEATPRAVSELFESAAKALSRAARDVAETGQPDPDAAESQEFAERLGRTRTEEEVVVPIESLFYADGSPDILERGTAPRLAPPNALSGAELMSRGEHLSQVADELERAASPTQRELRLHSLAADLRALPQGIGGALEGHLARFALVARERITSGQASRAPHAFAALLREAGVHLRSAAERPEDPAVVAGLMALTEACLRVTPPPMPAVATTPPEPVPAAAPEREPELEIVPIETLLATTAAPMQDKRAPEPPVAAVGADLAASFLVYHQLLEQHGLGSPSLEALMGGTAVVVPAAPAPMVASVPEPEAIAPAPVAKVVEPEPAPPVEPAIVDITDLCYRGRAALQRAAFVRMEIRTANARGAPANDVQPLVEELMDLVELALIE